MTWRSEARPAALAHTRRLTSARCFCARQLTILMAQLGLACKATSRACAKAGIANLFGMAGDQNSSGDDQKKLDVLSNDIFISALVNSGACSVLVSEENEEPIIVPADKAGRFCVAFDPLDGERAPAGASCAVHMTADRSSLSAVARRVCGRLVQHRLQREHGHHLRRVREDDARHRHHRRHPAHGQ